MTLSEIQNTPKVELHRHLELSWRPETIKEIAPKLGFDLEEPGAFEHHFLLTKPMEDLASALHKFLDTQKLYAYPEIVERMAFEACEDAFKKENIRVLELRYAPTFLTDGHDHLSYEIAHEAIVKGIKKAEETYPMAVGLTGTFQRILGPEGAKNILPFFLNNKDTFDAIDLADSEIGFEPAPFAPYFQEAKKAGLHVTVHAGEAADPGTELNILSSVNDLGATRIGHGLQAYRSEEVLNFLSDKKIPLEISVTSNLLTGSVKDIKDHPIQKLLSAGVQVALCTDDPGIFDTDMNKEYQLLVEHFDFTKQDFISANQIAFDASFIKEDKKNAVWNKELWNTTS